MSMLHSSDLTSERERNLPIVKENVVIKEEISLPDLIFNEHGELPIKTEIAENTENGNEGRLSFVNRERPTFVNLSQDLIHAQINKTEISELQKNSEEEHPVINQNIIRPCSVILQRCQIPAKSKIIKKGKNKKLSIECLECNRKFSCNSNLYAHIRIVHNKHRRYKCEQCKKTFTSNTKLSLHLETHFRPKVFECDMCRKMIKCKPNLMRHIKTHLGFKRTCKECNRLYETEEKAAIHNAETPFLCEECGKSFRCKLAFAKDLKIHEEGKPFKCGDCNKKFLTNVCLITHRNGVHLKLKPYECNDCGKRFFNRSQLRTHLWHHGEEKPKPHKCNECQKSFREEKSLKKHILTHTHRERKFECDICQSKFFNKAVLISHQRNVHTEEKPHVCSQCKKCYKKKEYLKEHMLVHLNENEKLFKCDKCEKSYHQNRLLRRHQRQIHEGIKQKHKNLGLKCTMCPKTFRDKYDLKSHLERHDVNRATYYQCDICLKKFLFRPTLTHHILNHLGENKPYQCKICQKKFSQAKQLKDHQLRHKKEYKYKCALCPKGFFDKANMISHSTLHTGEMPFLCNECGKTFRSKIGLVTHLRSHTGERPYQCAICEKQFKCTSSKNVHEKTHYNSKNQYCCNGCGIGFRHKPSLVKHFQKSTKCTNNFS